MRISSSRNSVGGSRREGSAEDLHGTRFSISIETWSRKSARKEGIDSVNSTTPINAAPADLVAEVEALGQRLSLVRERIGEVIFGQAEVVEQALITLLSGGHALLIGVPGLAQNPLVQTPLADLRLVDKSMP